MSPAVLARGYLWLMALAATGMQVYWLQTWRGPQTHDLGLVGLMVVLAVLAQHFPITITRQRKVDVTAAVYFASLLLFGAPLGVAVAGFSHLLGQVSLTLRRNPVSGKRRRTLRSALFNTSQVMVATGAGGVAYYTFLPHRVPAALERAENLWALPIAAVLMYFVNTAAVTIMAGLHLGQHPIRLWIATRRQTLLEFAGLYLVGVVVARAGAYDPLIVPAMVLPTAIIYWSMERTVRLEAHARREAEITAWRDLERMKTDFLRSVSHELSTPVSLICGFAELLRNRVAEVDGTDLKVRELANKLDTHARLLARLTDDLLDFARIERGEILLQSVDFDLVPTLQDLLEALRRQPGGQRLVGRLPATLPVHGDPARAAQCVFNLLANAMKYAPEGPISLRAALVGGSSGDEGESEPGRRPWARIEVVDQGPGIPAAEHPRVWQRFYRSPSVAGLHPTPGTGVGLAMVKALVEAQGGRVGLQSAPGQGARFWIDLPAAMASLADARTQQARDAAGIGRVLRLLEHSPDHSI